MSSCKEKFRRVWAAFLISVSFAAAAAEQDQIVKSIDVQYVGFKTVSEQRILAHISTRVGKPLSVMQVDQDVKSLHASGEVSNARFLVDKVSGGVALTVVVECRPLYGGVAFDGNSVFLDRKLARIFKLPLNQPISESDLLKGKQQIKTLYRKKGYPETEVNYQLSTPSSRGISQVLIRIEERSQGVLRKVHFAGNSKIPDSRLKEAMSQKEKGIQNLIGGGGRTDPDSIANDVRAIEDQYRNSGYFDARVVGTKLVRVDSKNSDLMITIDEGLGTTVSGIEVIGNHAISDEELARYIKSSSGKPFSGNTLQKDIERITELYQSRGYIDVRVIPYIDDPPQE